MVDIHAIPLFKATFSDVELVSVLCGECGQFRVILFVENMSEEMILELHDEVLGKCQ